MGQLQNASESVGRHISEILRLFKPGVKITVLVRATEFPDGTRDFVQTNDTLDDAISALQLRKHAPSITMGET